MPIIPEKTQRSRSYRANSIILLVVLILFSFCIKAQSPNEILEKYFRAVSNGNIDNWNHVQTVYIETCSFYSHANFEQNNPPELNNKGINYLKKYIDLGAEREKIEFYNDSAFSTLLHTFYFFKDKVVSKVEGLPPTVDYNKSDSRNGGDESKFEFHPALIRRLLKKNKAHEIDINDSSRYNIEIRTKTRVYNFFFDKNNYLLESIHISLDKITSITRYSNFKSFEGLLIPMTEITSRNEVPFFWSTKTKVVFNRALDMEFKEDTN